MIHIIYFLTGLFFTISAVADSPLGLPPLTIPPSNQLTAEKIALGLRLFQDQRFSGDGTISCATCHKAEKAFTDGLPVASGIAGQTGTRNAPTLLNAAFYQTFFLDGRRSSLEQQALDPFTNPIEHGLTTHQKIIEVIRNDSDYPQQFNLVYKVEIDDITIDHVGSSIAAYERTLVSGNSAYDRYLFGRDKKALSKSAARGLKIFRRKGNCANCHEISWDHALFTDNNFYNIGIGMQHLKPVLDTIISKVKQGQAIDKSSLTEQQHSELGRFNVTNIIKDIGKFKTPTLRNITLTAPYMHDGSMETLQQVVDYYDKGGETYPFKDPAIFPLHLSNQEKTDLVNFMKALESYPTSTYQP